MTDITDDTQLLMVEEAAERLKISRDYVYRLIKDGELASVKIGRSRRISEACIAEFIEAKTVPTRRTRRRVA